MGRLPTYRLCAIRRSWEITRERWLSWGASHARWRRTSAAVVGWLAGEFGSMFPVGREGARPVHPDPDAEQLPVGTQVQTAGPVAHVDGSDEGASRVRWREHRVERGPAPTELVGVSGPVVPKVVHAAWAWRQVTRPQPSVEGEV